MQNLYIRYFDREAVVTSVDEAMDFLCSIREIKIETNVADRISAFLESGNMYPFRLKVSYSNYVLFLKTDANSLDEFREIEEMRRSQKIDEHSRPMSIAEKKKSIMDELKTINPGWYEGSLLFKRVVMVPETGKFEYQDTRFTVRCLAECALECYERMIDNLKCRRDVDQRSQFPSAKSSNFSYKFLCEA